MLATGTFAELTLAEPPRPTIAVTGILVAAPSIISAQARNHSVGGGQSGRDDAEHLRQRRRERERARARVAAAQRRREVREAEAARLTAQAEQKRSAALAAQVAELAQLVTDLRAARAARIAGDDEDVIALLLVA